MDLNIPIQNEIQESEKLFRVLAETAASAIFIYQNENICYANPATENITGYSQKDLSEMKFWDIAHPDFREFIKERGLARLRGEQVPSRYEAKILTKNGKERWIDVAAASINFKNQPAVLVTAFDITERKQAEENLLALALIDELTGLYNRRGFFTLVDQELKIANRLKKEMLLLYADVDNLKLINDAYGHHEGDIALIEITNILKDTFRESDIIARIGGDEFTVLAIQTDDTNAEILHTRLQDNIKSYNANSKRRFRISISMGIVSYHPESPRPIHDLLREADILMYEQKQKKSLPSG